MKQNEKNQTTNTKGNKCKICGVYTEKIFLKVLVLTLPFRFSILSPFSKGCGKVFLCKTCPNLITTMKNLECHGSKITISIRYLPFDEMFRLISFKKGQRFFVIKNNTQQKVTNSQNKNKIKIKNQNKMKKKNKNKNKNKIKNQKEKQKKKKIHSTHNLPLNKLSIDFASIEANTNSNQQHFQKVKSHQLLSVFKTKGLEKSIQKKNFKAEKNLSKRWSGMTLKTGRQPTHDYSQICQISDEQILSFTLVDNHLILNNNNSSQSRQRSGSPTQEQASNNSQQNNTNQQQQQQNNTNQQQNNTNQQQQQQQQQQQSSKPRITGIQSIINQTQPQSDFTNFEFQQERTQELQEMRRRKQQKRREEQKRRLQDQKQKLLQQRQQLFSLSQEHENVFQNTTPMNKGNLKVLPNEKQIPKYSLELTKTDKKINPPFIQTVSGIGLNKSNVGQIPNNFSPNNNAYPRGRQKRSFRNPKRNSRMVSYFHHPNQTKKPMFQNNNEKQNQQFHSNLIQLKNNSPITNYSKLNRNSNNNNNNNNIRNNNNQNNNRNNNLIKNSLTSGYQSWLKDKISKNSNHIKNDDSKEKEDLKNYYSNLNKTNPKIISINPHNHPLDNISKPNSMEIYSFNNNRNNHLNDTIDDNKQLFFDKQYNNNNQNNGNRNYSLYKKRLNDFENNFDKVAEEEFIKDDENEFIRDDENEESRFEENKESRLKENEKNTKYCDPENEITFLKLLLQKKWKDEKNQKTKFQNFISLPFGLNEIDIDFQEKDQNIQNKEEGLFSKMKIPDNDEIIDKIMDNTNDLTDFIKDFEEKKQLKFLELLDEFESNKINFEKNISNILYRFNQKKFQIDKIILKSIGDSLTEKKSITKNIYHNFDYDDQEREIFPILQPHFLEWFQKIDEFDLENSLKKIDSPLRTKMKLNIEKEEKKKRKNRQSTKDSRTVINKNLQNTNNKNLSSESFSMEMTNKNENLTSKILILDSKKENMEIINTEKNETLSGFNENENANMSHNNYPNLIQKNNLMNQGEYSSKPKERKAIIDFFIYQIMGQFEYEVYPKPPLNNSIENQKLTINKNIVNERNSNSRSNDISGGSISSGSNTKELQNNLFNTTEFNKSKSNEIKKNEYQDMKEQQKIIQAQLQKLIREQEKNGFNLKGSPKTINNTVDFQKKQVVNKQIISIKPVTKQPIHNNQNRNINLSNNNNNNNNNSNSNIDNSDLNNFYGSGNVYQLTHDSNLQMNNQTFVKRKYDNYSKKYNKSDYYSNHSQQKFRNFENPKYRKHGIHQSEINQRNNFSNTQPQKNLSFQRNQYQKFLPNNEKGNFDSNKSNNRNISPFSSQSNPKQAKLFNDLTNDSTRKRVLTIKNDGDIFNDLIEPQKKIIKIQTTKNIIQHFPKKN
ncbi:hypothetical protein M0812_17818 [Anaeramoeba flamelloides]|uniref:Uncharacterized protein n=1 Tax=Anaeramoeba flamelloides TaxID=1746091 RepID=A0AAV7Z1U3_9EUKA|nr:hypothetical protein M0812_17818 [Anaeramoeba flamelloides]